MMPSTSRKMDHVNENSSTSTTSSDGSISISPALAIIQKKFNILCDEIKKKNVWDLEIALEIDVCLNEFRNELQQGRQKRMNIAFICEIFENLQYLLNRFLCPPGFLLGNLGSTLSSIINLTIEVVRDENLCEVLRDNYGMIQVLTDVFHPSLKPDDITLILTCIKMLTRDFVIAWKAPYLYKLIDHLYSLIEPQLDKKQNTYLALQILINLCRKNVSCVLVAHESAHSRKIWKHVSKNLNTDMKASGLQEVLIGHFLVVVSRTQPENFIGGYQVIELTLAGLLDKFDNSLSYQKHCTTLLDAISDWMCSLSDKFEPIHKTCEPFMMNDLFPDQAKSLHDGKMGFLHFIERIITQLAGFFKGRRDTFEENFESSILRLLSSSLPAFIPLKPLLKSYQAALEIADKFFMNSFDAQDTIKMCLKFYVQVAEQLEKIDDLDRPKFKEIELGLQKVLNKLELDSGGVSSENMELIALTLRLFSTLAKQPAFSEHILQRLKTDDIKYVIQSLTNSHGVKGKALSQRSTCVIEILFLMAQHTREVAIFDLMMQLMNVPDISFHLAKCIQSRDENIISKALVVVSSVGFANNSLSSISKNIVTLSKRNCESSPSENDIMILSHPGVKRVHDILRSANALEEFEATMKKDKKEGHLLSQIISCYQLQQEMHEHDLASLNSQIIHSKQSNRSLNSIIKKQNQTMNSLIMKEEKTTEEMSKLHKTIEKLEGESKTVNSAAQKEILKLNSELASEKKSLASLNKLIQEKEGVLRTLEIDLETVTGERDGALQSANSLKEEKRTLTSSLNKTKVDLEASKTKCSELEQEMVVKKKEIINTRAQLDQQIKMVNTIRGLLGNNTFGGLLNNP